MKAIKLTMLAILTTSAISANAGVAGDLTTGMKDGIGQIWNTAGHPGAISAEAGTLGYGGNIAYGANEYTEVQIGWAGGDLIDLAGADAEFEIDDVDFTAETDFSTPYVAVQVRPFKNWLTVGMGALYMGKNEINATASPSLSKEFTYGEGDNEHTYTVNSDDATINTTLEFKNTVSPYLSVGLRPNINKRFGLFGELGVAYTGGIQTKINATGTYSIDGQTPIDIESSAHAADLQELKDNARQEIEDKISDYDDYFPIVKVGATMRF